MEYLNFTWNQLLIWIFLGRVFGELKSRATVHLEDGMLTAKIETPEEIYHIEPSWRHLKTNDKNKSPDQMIVYKESDVIHPEKTGT